MFPLVRSIVTPEPAMADSPCRRKILIQGLGIANTKAEAEKEASDGFDQQKEKFCPKICSPPCKPYSAKPGPVTVEKPQGTFRSSITGECGCN